MVIGSILGEIPIARPLPGAEGVRWVQVETGEEILTAADLAGARPGELVLVCRGAAASRWVSECPADAAVAAVLGKGEKVVDKTGRKQL